MAQTGLNCRSAAAAAAAVVAEKHGQGTVETAGSQIHHVLRIVVVEELLAQKMLVPVDSLDSHRRMPFGVFSFFLPSSETFWISDASSSGVAIRKF